jgi:hypothetical protein
MASSITIGRGQVAWLLVLGLACASLATERVAIPQLRVAGQSGGQLQLAWSHEGPATFRLYQQDGMSGVELLLQTADSTTWLDLPLPGAETLARTFQVGACEPCPFLSDILAWYALAGGGRDASGHDRHGDLSGSVTPAADHLGRTGHALHLAGGSHVDCGDPEPDVFDLWGEGATVAAWVRLDLVPPPPGPWAAIVLAKDDAQGNEQRKWAFALQSNSISFHINGPGYGSGYWIYSDPVELAPGPWHHVALSKSGSEYSFYLDGQPWGTRTMAAPVHDVQAPLTLGYAEPCCHLDGSLDEAVLIGRALSPAEVLWLYQN